MAASGAHLEHAKVPRPRKVGSGEVVEKLFEGFFDLQVRVKLPGGLLEVKALALQILTRFEHLNGAPDLLVAGEAPTRVLQEHPATARLVHVPTEVSGIVVAATMRTVHLPWVERLEEAAAVRALDRGGGEPSGQPLAPVTARLACGWLLAGFVDERPPVFAALVVEAFQYDARPHVAHALETIRIVVHAAHQST